VSRRPRLSCFSWHGNDLVYLLPGGTGSCGVRQKKADFCRLVRKWMGLFSDMEIGRKGGFSSRRDGFVLRHGDLDGLWVEVNM